MTTTPRMTAGRARDGHEPRPAKRTWQPVERKRNGWEVEASREWQRMPEVERVPVRPAGSRLRQKRWEQVHGRGR